MIYKAHSEPSGALPSFRLIIQRGHVWANALEMRLPIYDGRFTIYDLDVRAPMAREAERKHGGIYETRGMCGEKGLHLRHTVFPAYFLHPEGVCVGQRVGKCV